MHKTDDFLECLERPDAAASRAAEGLGVEDLYDRHIRLRIGEIIARAMQQATHTARDNARAAQQINQRREP